jgi:hypothetical protein
MQLLPICRRFNANIECLALLAAQGVQAVVLHQVIMTALRCWHDMGGERKTLDYVACEVGAQLCS